MVELVGAVVVIGVLALASIAIVSEGRSRTKEK